ncbi:MAG TPA: hypothetical protein VL179_05410 [Mycobacterium sp.]|nr:hypothetical protein [Mycobacterium sp.]
MGLQRGTAARSRCPRPGRRTCRELEGQADPLADGTAHISNVAGTLATLLADNRPALQNDLGYLDSFATPLVEQRDHIDKQMREFPENLNLIGRSGGIYGDFFNFYLCDISLKMNGLQPGGPVRTVRLTQQPSGRCTPR